MHSHKKGHKMISMSAAYSSRRCYQMMIKQGLQMNKEYKKQKTVAIKQEINTAENHCS